MSPDESRRELARRLHRIFITSADTGREVPQETLLRFADEILAANYTDPRWGPRKGDGGPELVLDLRGDA